MAEVLSKEQIREVTCPNCIQIYNALLLIKQEKGQWRLDASGGKILARQLTINGGHISIQHGLLVDGQRPSSIVKKVGQICVALAHLK